MYRMASSIQIVAFLTLLIFAYNEVRLHTYTHDSPLHMP